WSFVNVRVGSLGTFFFFFKACLLFTRLLRKKKMTNENPPAPTIKKVNEEKPQQEETATNKETQEEIEAKEHLKSSREAETFQFNANIAQLMRYFFFKKFLYAKISQKKKNKNVCITKKKVIRITKKKNTNTYDKNRLIINAVCSSDK
ncbi:hypothetical protein RFI_32891, partial [Reticulomyxa filosa]